MQAMHKRALLYGGASLLLSGIGYVWATHSADADAMTLLSSADVQLRLAYAIPALDKQGKALPAREEMITQAEKYLADVERIQPGMAVTAEFVGFAHSLRGRFEQAAAAYGRARQCQDCGDEQRDVLAFNQARMLAQGGKLEQALAAFTREAQSLDRRFGHQRSLEETTILRQLGRPAEAEARLSAILNDAAAPPMASLQAGLEYLELGKPAAAEQALTRAAASVPIADYHLARLKLQAGDVDTCLGLLERVAAAQPAEVRRRLREEAGAWSAVSADARFQELVSPRTGTPVR